MTGWTNLYLNIRRDAVQGENGDITDQIVAFVQERWVHFFGTNFTAVSHFPEQLRAHEGYIELTTKHPLFDEHLLKNMMKRSAVETTNVVSQGACPGTTPLIVKCLDAPTDANPSIEFSDLHFEYNCQLNIQKQKRLKIFLKLKEKFADLTHWPLVSILDYLSSESGTEFVLGYGENLQLNHYKMCPHCRSTNIATIRCGNSQPVVGFLTRKSRYYCQCGNCELVFLNPAPRPDDLHRLYDWYDLELDSFRAENLSSENLQKQNAYHAHHLRFLKHLSDHKVRKDQRILDVGGGTGRFCTLVQSMMPDSSLTLRDFRVPGLAYLRSQRIDASEGDVLSAEYNAGIFDAITLWEVIEHFRYEDIRRFFQNAERWLAPGGLIAISTPNMDSPLCRMIDFWAWFAPHHLTVLRPRILEEIARECGLTLAAVYGESVLLKAGRGDVAYAAQTHSSLAARAEAAIIDELLTHSPSAKQHLVDKGIGSEMVIVFEKPTC